MKKNNLKLSFITAVLCYCFYFQLNAQVIDRGRIEDVWSMKIVKERINEKGGSGFSYAPLARPIDIEPNQFFSLENLGLKPIKPSKNPKVYSAGGHFKMANCYEVEIAHPGFKEKFYGKIAFFNAKKKAMSKAVTSYYKLTVPAEKFLQSKEGRISYYYEYYDLKGGRYPTWILWISDVPIK